MKRRIKLYYISKLILILFLYLSISFNANENFEGIFIFQDSKEFNTLMESTFERLTTSIEWKLDGIEERKC